MTTFAPILSPSTALTIPADDMDLFPDQDAEVDLDIVDDSATFPHSDVMEEDAVDDDIMLDEIPQSPNGAIENQVQDEVLEDIDVNTTGTVGSPVADLPDAVDYEIDTRPEVGDNEHHDANGIEMGIPETQLGDPQASLTEASHTKELEIQHNEISATSLLGGKHEQEEVVRPRQEFAALQDHGIGEIDTNHDVAEEPRGEGQVEADNTELDPSLPQYSYPIVITYDGSEMSLFPPSGDDSSDTFLLQDAKLVTSSIKDLFKAIRMVLEGSFPETEELELGMDELGLSLSEDSSHCHDTSLSQILDLHVRLYAQDGFETPEPLYIDLLTKPGFAGKMSELAVFAESGHGISKMHPKRATDATEDNDQHAVVGRDEVHVNGEPAPQEIDPQTEHDDDTQAPENDVQEHISDGNKSLEAVQAEDQADHYEKEQGPQEGTQVVNHNVDEHRGSEPNVEEPEGLPHLASLDSTQDVTEYYEAQEEVEGEDLIDYEEDDVDKNHEAKLSPTALKEDDQNGTQKEGNLRDVPEQVADGEEGTSAHADPAGELEIYGIEAHGEETNDPLIDVSAGLPRQSSDSHEQAGEELDQDEDEIAYDNEDEWDAHEGEVAEPDAQANDGNLFEGAQQDELDESNQEGTVEDSLVNENEHDDIDYASDVEAISAFDPKTELKTQHDTTQINGQNGVRENSAPAVEEEVPEDEQINYDDDNFELVDLSPGADDDDLPEIEVEEPSLKRVHDNDGEEGLAEGGSQDAKRVRSE